jgi:peptide-methionine (R)-S-oxide reductase
MIDRRLLLGTVATLSFLAAFRGLRRGAAGAAESSKETPKESFEIEKSTEEWRKQLSASQFGILREHGTERPFSSPLNSEHRKGTFACAGCALPLFSSETKFDSGTGWPSFYQPLPGAVGTTVDRSYMMTRTEVHCHRCGGHLGHVFDDGPKPTGLRYCMNGLAMTFKAGEPSPS